MPSLSGKKLNREVFSQTEACHGKSIYAARSTSTSKKMIGTSVAPFNDGWPENEEIVIDMQAR